MAVPKNPRAFGASLLIVAAAVLLIGGGVAKVVDDAPPEAGADETTTTTAATGCGSSPTFFARDTAGNQFGPPAPQDPANVAATQADFASRRCQDAALLVADSEYLFNEFSDPETRVQRTIDLMADPAAWSLAETRFQNRLNEAVKVEIVQMSGRYQTMDMVDQDRMIPEIYQIPVEASPFWVLRYTFPGGSVANFKLNCGYQPVAQEFPPSVPGKAPAPSQGQPTAMPGKPGKPGHPGTSVPPTVPPRPGKCAGQTGSYCGNPDFGPGYIPPQENDPGLVRPTPGYPGPGNAGTVIGSQQPKPGADPYAPTPYGTSTGGSQTGPAPVYNGPGASSPTPGTNSGVTNSPTGPAATNNNPAVGQTSGAGSDPGGW